MTLRDMRIGEKATIIMICGGRGAQGKLESMGLREGSSIVKKSAVMAGGPVIVEVGSTQIAIGSELARKIIVKITA